MVSGSLPRYRVCYLPYAPLMLCILSNPFAHCYVL